MKIAQDIRAIIKSLRRVLKAENIEYDEFVDKFLQRLSDKEAIIRVHASSNPYIPRKLRVDCVKIAEEVE